ncbi:hypothetical protein NPIL_596471 [Nephila pilipes]|uniref:Uncharacterized protein n=1 Tax=Nephila pilipes TaxID=299642 RepID=A0A8X6TRT8_NEPPI|nr:hypothetical protein NPIL_596471 [Nephila pilipes]
MDFNRRKNANKLFKAIQTFQKFSKSILFVISFEFSCNFAWEGNVEQTRKFSVIFRSSINSREERENTKQ